MYAQFAQKFTKESCIMWNTFPSVTSLFQQVNSVIWWIGKTWFERMIIDAFDIGVGIVSFGL